MSKFDIKELAARPKSDEENDNALGYFRSIAFPGIPVEDIILKLQHNREEWKSVWVRKGKEGDDFPYTDNVLSLAAGKRENIICMVIFGTSKSIVFISELKDYADDFSFSSYFSLPNDLTAYILYFA